ncbi:MAG: PPOX class F420-dependent oxidoreductase [Chloroflexota bacterium]|nr:PPOX class F420-dependent oxidoreductase [Chloroflexota bacterium]
MPSFTANQLELLSEPHVAQFVTLMDDGSPQISPVWIDTDGSNLLINTATGRLKTNNIERDSRVAVAVFDPQDPYSRVVNVTGIVTDITTSGAIEHINKLSQKYTGQATYQGHNNKEERLIVTIKPTRITGN